MREAITIFIWTYGKCNCEFSCTRFPVRCHFCPTVLYLVAPIDLLWSAKHFLAFSLCVHTCGVSKGEKHHIRHIRPQLIRKDKSTGAVSLLKVKQAILDSLNTNMKRLCLTTWERNMCTYVSVCGCPYVYSCLWKC